MSSSGRVIRGPWTGPVVEQPHLPSPLGWWERLPDGRLLVRCHGARRQNERYQIAPIAEWNPLPGQGRRWNAIPDRAPNRDRITAALDYHGLFGPEVDEALGVADAFDTVVDAWETGDMIPTESEIRRLAMLTGMPPAWFYAGTLPTISDIFLCPPSPTSSGKRVTQ